MNFNAVIGETLVCPVCGKSFKVTEDTKYVAAGGFTCDWNCFLVVAKAKSNKKK